MDTTLAPGSRCRANRSIPHPGGMLQRASAGTILSTRENIGHQLVTVRFDGGPRLVLFAHELDVCGEVDGRSSAPRRATNGTAPAACASRFPALGAGFLHAAA